MMLVLLGYKSMFFICYLLATIYKFFNWSSNWQELSHFMVSTYLHQLLAQIISQISTTDVERTVNSKSTLKDSVILESYTEGQYLLIERTTGGLNIAEIAMTFAEMRKWILFTFF
jgi:hypothetical protein